jgi:cytochrome c-type biogenesis protein CcmH
MKKIALLLAIALLSSAAFAIDTLPPFDDPELQARYEKIIGEVRCLKCQNQTIKDSSAFLAGDLRREIHRMVGEGKSEEEIYDFLVDRYGEFALYRPRTQGKTLLLWLAPAGLLVIGGIAIAMTLRRRMALPIDEDAPEEQD